MKSFADCSTPATAAVPSPAGAWCSGKEIVTEEIPAYAAVALAGLGWLPDTILSRSVIVRMRRRHQGERVEPFRRRIHGAQGHAYP